MEYVYDILNPVHNGRRTCNGEMVSQYWPDACAAIPLNRSYNFDQPKH